ncbi:MAG: histidine phosphatase family protein [Chloroflexi bacterium]|nr:histidine phosphatase family protein [Chloroflexota bacterium]
MLLYLIRHGETDHNRDGLGLGRADVPLTPHGLAQSEAVARRLASEPVSRILSSPLQRAATVAAAIGQARGVEVELRDELAEMDIGETEGLAFAEMRARFPEFLSRWTGPAAAATPMPGGESLDDVRDRILPLLAGLRTSSEQAVALVSHNFVIRVMLCELLGLPSSSFRSFGVDLASVSAISFDRGRLNVRFLNDCCHLAHLEPSRYGA